MIQDVFDAEHFRHHGYQLIDQLADLLANPSDIVIPYQKPEDALSFWHSYQNDDPNEIFAEVIKRSTKLHHPHYLGHQVVPPAPISVLAGALSEFLNNGMAVYEMGMASNPIERIVCEWMCRQIGFDSQSNGIVTSGGTLGNLTALLTARAHMTEVWENGSTERIAIMVSAEAHYCVDRAARIMGLGSNGVIKVPVDNQFKMRTDLLHQYYDEATVKGMRIFAIVGSAASTSTGAYEDLHAIADFAHKTNIWLHVDAAHGGAVIFSDKHRHLVNGMDRADSVVIDFHKMMMVPALATGVFYRRGQDSYGTFHQKAQYLWASEDEDWYNSGKRTFECTKLGMCLRVYTLWKVYGEAIFEKNVDTLYSLGTSFAAMVNERLDFELAIVPQANIVNFRYTATSSDLNFFNTELRQRLTEKGHFYIVQTSLNGKIYLRISIMNPLTTLKDLAELLDELATIASG